MIDVHVDSQLIFQNFTSLVCAQALEKSFQGVTFMRTLVSNSMQDSDEYFEKLKTIPEILYKYKLINQGKLNLYNGVEFLIDCKKIDEVLKIIHFYEFDYVVASLVPDSANTSVSTEDYLQFIQKYVQYFSAFSRIENLIDWCYLSGDEGIQKERLALLDSSLQVLISNYKCLELDTSKETISPRLIQVLQRYKELGGSLVSLGSNAKITFEVGQGSENFMSTLIEIGFSFTTHYSNKNPIHDSLIIK